MQGDLDLDNAVTLNDYLIAFDRYWESRPVLPEDGDIGFDGEFDQADFLNVIAHLGQSVDSESAWALARLIVAGLVNTPESMAGGTVYPNHNVIFSAGNHDSRYSNSHPNHGTALSSTWPKEIERHALDYTNLFPNNHNFGLSNTWPSDPAVHSVQRSSGWPVFHHGNDSSTWPSSHNNMVSMNWPGGHAVQLSQTSRPPIRPMTPQSHKTYISREHSIQFSNELGWPVGHSVDFSDTWAHALDLSANFPANHNALVSDGWRNDPYPSWPPNHFWASSQGFPPTPPAPPPVAPSDQPNHQSNITQHFIKRGLYQSNPVGQVDF